MTHDDMIAQSGRVTASFESIDHLAATIGYELDFRQLESGPLSAVVNSTTLGSIVRNDFYLDRAFHQRGKMPTPGLTFGYVRNNGHLRWAGKDVGPGKLLNFNSRSGFDLKSNHCFNATTFHVDRYRLLDTADALGFKLEHLDNEEFATPYTTDPAILERLQCALQATEFAASSVSEKSIAPEALEQIEAEIYRCLAACLGDQPRGNSGSVSIRYKTLQRALGFIDEHLRDNITVTEVCRASATSIRTLQRTFLEELGTSPKQYIQLAKFAAARRDLLTSNEDTPIGQVALCWGFWHMGQFAQDYRRLYGELPSETRNNRSHKLSH